MGRLIEINLLDLRPTQFAVGMSAVLSKQKKIEKMPRKDLRRYIRERTVPVVTGMDGDYFMIDRHHLTRALWQAGEKKVFVDVLKDWSHLPSKPFWEKMKRQGWVYLYDQFGRGPHNVQCLPRNVISLADDPFRSLAKAVQEAGAIPKSPRPFSEFAWANFFRNSVPIELVVNDFKAAIALGIQLIPEKAALPRSVIRANFC